MRGFARLSSPIRSRARRRKSRLSLRAQGAKAGTGPLKFRAAHFYIVQSSEGLLKKASVRLPSTGAAPRAAPMPPAKPCISGLGILRRKNDSTMSPRPFKKRGRTSGGLARGRPDTILQNSPCGRESAVIRHNFPDFGILPRIRALKNMGLRGLECLKKQRG